MAPKSLWKKFLAHKSIMAMLLKVNLMLNFGAKLLYGLRHSVRLCNSHYNSYKNGLFIDKKLSINNANRSKDSTYRNNIFCIKVIGCLVCLFVGTERSHYGPIWFSFI